MPNRFAAILGLIATLGVGAMPLSACSGDDPVAEKPQPASRGQQLIDLQRAYESGAISRKEYEHEREKVLKEK